MVSRWRGEAMVVLSPDLVPSDLASIAAVVAVVVLLMIARWFLFTYVR
jgi:hypothetical protein